MGIVQARLTVSLAHLDCQHGGIVLLPQNTKRLQVTAESRQVENVIRGASKSEEFFVAPSSLTTGRSQKGAALSTPRKNL